MLNVLVELKAHTSSYIKPHFHTYVYYKIYLPLAELGSAIRHLENIRLHKNASSN
uniref:Uncharacterized protein n=1 Tax=Rhizophora mucronata TaxID=61149 RepID=A0A2P2Q681_RHIMU